MAPKGYISHLLLLIKWSDQLDEDLSIPKGKLKGLQNYNCLDPDHP